MKNKTYKEVYEEFLDYGMKESSAQAYTRGLMRFVNWVKDTKDLDVDPFTLLDLGIDKIEKLTQRFIRRHQTELAPKYLNIIYCSIKRWVTIKELIKSSKMFKEIKFDKSSRKTEALTETALETQHIKDGFKVSTLDKKIDFGLYGLCGLRPAIIPRAKVSWIFRRNRTIKNGKLTLTKPAIMVVPRIDPETKKPLKGNKGNISFMVFIPTRLCELIELRLNHNHAHVTLDTHLSASPNAKEVYYKIKTIYAQIGFKGRPYLLRSYADGILDAITRIFHDEDFKEFLMGHKGKISAVYQIKGITQEAEDKYRGMYVQACDSWINEHIFEQRSESEKQQAQAVIIGLKASGVNIDSEKIQAIQKLFDAGKLTFEQFTEKLQATARDAFKQQLTNEFETLYLKMQEKHNNESK